MKCPICRKGELPDNLKKLTAIEMKKRMAKILVKNGFSYRQVASYLGWKSHRSVALIVN